MGRKQWRGEGTRRGRARKNDRMCRNADDPPDEDYLDELHIDEELADGCGHKPLR